MLDAPLTATTCAICGADASSTEVYAANLDARSFTAEVFSARRAPDRRHYRWVRCDQCSLLRSDPVLSPDALARLYGASAFDYVDEVDNLRWTYRRLLEDLLPARLRAGRLLEIGGGNGFLLREALDLGFTEVAGVEPSAAAIAAADPSVRPAMVCDVMRPGLFPDEHFDVACLFHVMDHVSDPLGVLETCRDVLRPGGMVVTVVHDAAAWPARLLGRRSPIVDVEHTYLFARPTAERLLTVAGFEDVGSRPLRNRYSAAYLLGLAPLPARLRAALLAGIGPLRRRSITLPLGNLVTTGSKAADQR